MQAVFHSSQPSVQYPRYLSEHETKAAAAATDIQPANSHTPAVQTSSTQLFLLAQTPQARFDQ